ncbi:MAG: winged helix-turn-helix transcriptional regulator [Sphingomonadales bacterium]|nr:winged helix-turn-helix transcriptional regulator [Sphingomonadales bacterium]MDE2169326.1 winged helix-turn-helix transcriptional regulator [Sphingomonadales bacterium]
MTGDPQGTQSHRPAIGLSSDSRLRDLVQSLDMMVNELHLIAEADQAENEAASACTNKLERAKQIYRNRRRREQVFGDAALFGEPAWDIMLDLYVAAAEDKRVAVTSACIGSAVPATTALRWIKILEDRNLIEREVDEVDARRIFVRLSTTGFELMEEYLSE